MSDDRGSEVLNEVSSPITLHGNVVDLTPRDLYIPPDALVVFLESFQGPLDLLLYLIRKQNVDILEISVAEITEQYMKYIEMMTYLRLQLAGDYLVMAATLTEIKSAMLLPTPDESQDDEDDPRLALLRRLQEYERIKAAAEELDGVPRLERDIHPLHLTVSEADSTSTKPKVGMGELVFAFAELLQRSKLYQVHAVEQQRITVNDRIQDVLEILRKAHEFVRFQTLFSDIGRPEGLVYTFLALLELMRRNDVNVVQNKPYDQIFVSMRT